jgi:catechol 2,3-dioxygenase-like lactoylglutathione lyase family enzyme
MAQFPAPVEGIAITHFIVSKNVERARRFYVEVLGGEAVLEGELSIVALANGWITIGAGGGPTDDKPNVTLEPPPDPNRVSGFLDFRVADLAPSMIDRGDEIRCYMRDPGGHLIEVGQLVGLVQG